MASNSQYNALIKSLPDANSQSKVTGKLFLTDLNILPPKWTVIFRGKHLSRDVNMENLLCSSNDPIIIYKGIVKFPLLSFSVQIDCSKVTQFEGYTNIRLEVKPLDSVENLQQRIATQLGEPHDKIVLMYTDRLLEKYESLQDCKIVKDGTKLRAKFIGHSEYFKVVQPTPRISKTFKVCLGGNKAEDKEKLAFFNAKLVIEVMNCDTVGMLKQRICAKYEVDAIKYNILMDCKILEDWETLESQNFQEGENIDLGPKPLPDDEKERKKEIQKLKEEKRKEREKLKKGTKGERLRKGTGGFKMDHSRFLGPLAGGGSHGPLEQRAFSAQDVNRKAILMSGEEPTHDWNLYSFGMNLYGTCTNRQCISKKETEKNKNGVSHNAGYGNIILTVERNKFPCSACQEMFPVKEFVLCGGRALFRFKKSGVGEPVKTVVIESVYDLMKYATFDNTAKNKKVKTSSYHFIEITTVKPWCGLYACVGCDEMIRFKHDENVLRCGHAYHNECTPINVGSGSGDANDSDSNVGCNACNARQLQSVYDMLGMEGTSSSLGAALVGPL